MAERVQAEKDRLEEMIRSSYLNTSEYIHVYFRAQIRSYLRSAQVLLDQFQQDQATIAYLKTCVDQVLGANEAGKAEAGRKIDDLTREFRAKMEATDKAHQAAAARLDEEMAERLQIAEKVKELEKRIQAEKKLNTLLFDFARVNFNTFFGWVASKGVKVDYFVLLDFVNKFTSGDITSLIAADVPDSPLSLLLDALASLDIAVPDNALPAPSNGRKSINPSNGGKPFDDDMVVE